MIVSTGPSAKECDPDMTKQTITDLLYAIMRHRFIVDLLLFNIKLETAKRVDLVEFLSTHYPIHGSTAYKQLKVLENECLLVAVRSPNQRLSYRVPGNIRSLLLQFLKFQGKYKVQYSNTEITRTYFGQYIAYEKVQRRSRQISSPTIILEPLPSS